MNTIRRKMRPEFQGLQGGLFSSVKKQMLVPLYWISWPMVLTCCAGQILFPRPRFAGTYLSSSD